MKKETREFTVFSKAIFIFCILFIFFLYGCSTTKNLNISDNITANNIRLDEHNNVILRQIMNHDNFCIDKFELTLEDVNNLIAFIRSNYSYFDFNEAGYATDDSLNELFIKEFNTNPLHMVIYLSGIAYVAGYTSIYSYFYFNDNNELFNYFISVDEQYSDLSGVEFRHGSFLYPSRNDSLTLVKLKYRNSDNPYWIIYWNFEDDINEYTKTLILNNFLNQFRYTKVYQNIDIEWFKNIYTGIEANQKIRDIVEW